jgi:hypothetical protein
MQHKEIGQDAMKTAMHKRILFEIEKDEDGFPPVGAETVWAIDLGGNKFKIDNIPFFARDATLGDVVEAHETNGMLCYKQTVNRSGNSLIRIVYYPGTDPTILITELKELGCEAELDGHDHLIAVSVPPHVPLESVQSFLQQGSEQDRFGYEEAILMQ